MGFCASGQRETGRRKQLNTPIFFSISAKA